MAEVRLPRHEVETPVYKVRYDFVLRGFDKILSLWEKKRYRGLESPIFHHPDTPHVKWSLFVYPIGSGKESAGFVSVYLDIHDPPAEGQQAMVSFLADNNQRDVINHKFTAEQKNRGYDTFMSHDKIKYEEPGVFVVTAVVEYSCGEPVAKATQPPPPKQPSLFPLLYSAWLSDFSLEVEGEAVPVHRNILSVASPVFHRMFAQHMSREAKSHTAVLQDTSMPAVKTMLRFAYTGRLDREEGEEEEDKEKDANKAKDKEAGSDDSDSEDEEGTSETKTEPAPTAEDVGELCEVLALAHRYDMAGLGRAAEARLKGLLGQATLLPVAAAANLHDFTDLLQACREEVRSGRVELKAWKEFAKAQPDLIPKLTLPADQN